MQVTEKPSLARAKQIRKWANIATRHWETSTIVILVAAYLVLALGFSLAPPFEGAEELEHYRFIRTLVQTRQLPDPYEAWGGQYHQAPLYYLLLAPIRAVMHDSDFVEISTRLNPFYGYAFTALGNDNKNLFLHRQAELFPFRGGGTARIVYVMRLFSIILGIGVLTTSYALFYALWPDHPHRRVTALAVITFQPHFLQVSATINNDNLLILLSTMMLMLLVRMERNGWTFKGAGWLGITLGLALLTKVNAMFLAIPVGFAVLSDLRQRWRYAAFILALVALIAGWWYLRNWVEYGDPTGGSVLFTVTQPGEAIHDGGVVPSTGWPRLRFAYETFWARFGDGRVSVADSIYDFFDLVVIITLAGLAIWAGRIAWAVIKKRAAIRKLNAVIVGIVVIYAATWVLLLVYYSSRAWSGVQGRYLLPGIAAWAIVIVWGADAWLPQRARRSAALGLTIALGGIAFVCLFGYYRPAYQVSDAPEHAEGPIYYAFDDTAAIIGFTPTTLRAFPGERVRVTLTWTALNSTENNFQSYVHSVESDVARRDSYPATGNLLSTDWQPGDTWAEHFVVDIPADAEPGHKYTLVAGLYDPSSGRTLAAVNANGEHVTPVVGRLAINRPGGALTGEYYRFGTLFEMTAPQIEYVGDMLTICLTWRTTRTTNTDYMLFAHVLDRDGSPIGQHDGPAGGDYPTGVWARGEVVDQCLTLTMPNLPDDTHIALGMYDLATLTRLPVTDKAGNPLLWLDRLVKEISP